MSDLQRKFYDVDLSGNDEHSSQIKVGRHSVVLYIQKMCERGEGV